MHPLVRAAIILQQQDNEYLVNERNMDAKELSFFPAF